MHRLDTLRSATIDGGVMKYWLHSLLAAACLLTASASLAAFHLFSIEQIYSNADGTIQFIVLTCPPASCANGENFWAGSATLTSTHAGTTKTFTASSNLPSSATVGKKVLVATPGFAALGLVAPDYTIPNGFLPTDSGTIGYVSSSITYKAGELPTDGANALYIDGSVKTNLATNFAGASASVTPSGPPPAAVNYQGLWWATGGTEAFWGINFAHSGDQVFGTWYTYDTSGKAWWLSMLAGRTTPSSNEYTGDINVDVGPPFDNFVGSGKPTKVGTGTLTFSDANTGTFHYDLNTGTGGSPVPVSQTKAIERYNLGTGPQPTCTFSATADLALATNYQDLWWATSGMESGWGVNFAHQGDSVFLTWYTYDSGGAPLWLSALTQRQGATNVYTGSLLRTSGPRFDNYKASDVVMPIPAVGTATLTFANGNSATFNYTTNGNGGLPAGVNQTKSIVRFPITAGGTLCN
ncbi:MAG TPA: hypothetical protein VF959_06920 [Casimicrobiaceae bacterium]